MSRIRRSLDQVAGRFMDKALDAEVALATAGRLSPRRLDRLVDMLSVRIEDTIPPRQSELEYQLQVVLLVRFQVSGQLVDVHQALGLAEAATAMLPADDPRRALEVVIAGHCRSLLYQAEGDPGHLDAAIASGLSCIEDEQLNRLLQLTVAGMVASARVLRWERRGELADLTEAIETLRQVVAEGPPGVPDRPMYLAQLGLALLMRYELSEDDAHLNEAGQCGLEASAAVCDEDPARGEILSITALILSHGGRRHDGEPTLLEASLQTSEEAVRVSPPGGANRFRVLNHHVAVLMCAGELLRRSDLLGQAIEVGQAMLDQLPPSHQTRGACLANVATAARMRFDQSGDAADAQLAVSAWRTVSQAEELLPWTRLDAAQKWGLLEGGRGAWASALDAHRTALSILPRLADEDLPRPDRELHLERRARVALASDAAACALNTGNPYLAVELLEAGRALIWDQVADSTAPEPVSAQDLVAGWGVDGPAIVINFSRWRSDALAVSRAGIRLVPLPDLAFDEAIDHVLGYLRVLLKGDDPAERQRSLSDLLAWSWERIGRPVLEALGYVYRGPDAELPRVWWSPTNIFSLVPIHAAGYHAPAGVPGDSVIERVVSSYTPALRVLSGAAPAPETSPPRLLIAAVSGGLGLGEVDHLVKLFPEGRHTLLTGEAATTRGVLQALADHDYVHFGCHGRQDFAQPSAGGLALHDGTLTVAELAAEPRLPGKLAFLAACEAAAGGLVNSDEAISLAAALRFAGWRDVIGPLMPVPDSSAAAIARAVFTAAAAPGQCTSEEIARALHQVLLDRRNRHRAPLLWAPFLHMGR